MPASKDELLAFFANMTPEEKARFLQPNPELLEERRTPEAYGSPLSDAEMRNLEARQKTEPTRTQREATTPDHSEDKYAATKWGGSEYEDLECPSGQTCLVRRPGLQGLIKAGILHDIDPLMQYVQQHEGRMTGMDDQVEIGKEIMKDPSQLAAIMHMVDRVACHVVVKPRVVMTPNDVTLRQEGVIYADMVDLEDKMFIMNYAVGGAADVADFRKELTEVVGNVVDEPESGSSSE